MGILTQRDADMREGYRAKLSKKDFTQRRMISRGDHNGAA
jgi:hypothetical protein